MFVHSAALGSFVCLFAFTGNIFVFFQLLCSSGPLLICFQHISAGLNERNGISVDIWYMNSINFGNKVLVSVWLFGCLRFYSVQLILEERGVSQCLRKYAGLVLCVARCVALQLINVKHVEQRFYINKFDLRLNFGWDINLIQLQMCFCRVVLCATWL